jgi:hypothetical protein
MGVDDAELKQEILERHVKNASREQFDPKIHFGMMMKVARRIVSQSEND